MKDEPNIVKMLREEETFGRLQSKMQGAYEELETPKEASDDVPDETVSFAEDDDAEKKETVCDGAAYEQTVKESPDSEMYRTIFENVSDEIIYVNKHGKIVNVNRRSYDIFGYKPEEMIGKNFSRLGWLGVRDLPKMLKLFKDAIRGKTIDLMELEVKHRDGHIVPVEVSTRPVKKNGKTVGFLSIVRDITERKKAEGEINYLKEYNENILESNPNSIIVIKGDQIEYVNKSFISTFGKTRNDYISKKLKEVIPVFEKLLHDQNKMKELEVKGKSFSVSSFVVKKAEEEEEEEEEERIGIVLQDITERKQAEKDLQERVKELKCLYGVASITEKPGITLNELYSEVANLLPLSLQYPENVCARVIINNMKFETENFRETEWKQSADIKVYGTIAGVVEVFYLEEKPDSDEGPFLKDERVLIEAIAERLGRITERMQAEEKIKKSNEKFQEIFNGVSDAIFIHDLKDFSIIDVNDETCKRFGYTREEIKNMSVDDLSEGELFSVDAAENQELFKKIMNGEVVTKEWLSKNKDDDTFWHELTVKLVEIEGEKKLLAIARDINDRKKAEVEIKLAREELDQIFNTAADGMRVIDKDFNMLRINETLSNLTGIDKDEAIGKKCYEVFFSSLCRTPDCPLTRIFKGDKHVECEIEKERKDGTKISYILTATPFKGIDGELLGIVEDFKDITQWKRAEEKFKILFNSSRDAIMTLDPPSWKFTSANPSTVELFNAKEELEFTSKGPWDVSPENQPDGTSSSEKAKKMIEEAMKEGSSFFEWTHKTLDGKEFPSTVLLTRVEIEEGKPFLQATVRDITEQKIAEEKMKESEEKFRTMSASAQDGVIMMDHNGNVSYWNEASEQMFGYKPDEIIEKNLHTILAPQKFHEAHKKGFSKFKNTGKGAAVGKTLELAALKKDGTEFPIELSMSSVKIKDKWHAIGIIRDITERKKAGAALQESVERYHELIEGSHDGYLMTDMDDKIVEYNNVFKEITGYTNGELHKKTHKDITPKEWHSIEDKIIKEQVIKNGYSEVYEKELIGKDGRIIPVEFRRYLIKEKGEPVTTWSFVRDITDRKQTKDELLEKINALERYKNITVGRELRIIELKKKIKKLEQKLEMGKG